MTSQNVSMFVANCTRQNYDFMYRLPSFTGPRRAQIKIGGQTEIKGLAPDDVRLLIEGNEKYGMVEASTVDQRKGTVIHLIYALGSPVPAKWIERAMRANSAEDHAEGKRIRQATAVAYNNVIEQSVEESGRPEVLNNLKIETVEEKPDSDGQQLAEGFEVTREAQQRNASSRRRR